MRSLPDCLEEFARRPLGLLVEEPRCGQCGQPEYGLIDGLCAGCERAIRAAKNAEKRLAAALADQAGTLAGFGVPPRYCEPFEEPESWPRDPKTAVGIDAWRGELWLLFLTGHTGVGKSFIATELLWRAYLRRAGLGTARFVRASRVPGLVFGGERSGDDGEVVAAMGLRPPLATLVDVEVLVLDELGLGHPGGGWEALDDLAGRSSWCLDRQGWRPERSANPCKEPST